MNFQYYLFKYFSKLVSLLPYGIVIVLGKLLGHLYYYVVPRQRRLASAHIQRGLSISAEEADLIVRRLFVKIGMTFFEVLYMPALTPENIKRHVLMGDRHYMDEAVKQGHGVVLLTAHVGNWEWLGAALAMAGFPLTSVIKRQPNDQHTRLLNEYRQMVGIEIFARGTTELIGAAKALKKGKILGFLADQDAGDSGIFVEFLGEMASTPVGPAAFARKFKSPIVPTFIVRCPEGGHRVLMYPPLYYEDTGDEAADLRRVTEAMTRVLEDTIRTYPDEWLWFQRRWNTKYEKHGRREEQTQRERKAGEAV